MKKTVFLILVTAILTCFAFTATCAEGIDLSSLSYDELIALQSKITLEIMSRPDFKKVKVPPGAYKVGVDIPAGKWTITASEGACEVYWGKSLDEYGVSVPWSDRIDDLDDWGSNSTVSWNLICFCPLRPSENCSA